MLITKITSSLEKPFSDSDISSYPSVRSRTALLGERFSLQLLYTADKRLELYPKISGPLARFVKLHEVAEVPVAIAAPKGIEDPDYLRYTPGLFPDLLVPYKDSLIAAEGLLGSLWLEIFIPTDEPDIRGESELRVELLDSFGNTLSKESVTVDIIGAELPPSTLTLTQWFYTDCLARYYGVEVFSDRHFEIIERFAEVAVKNGINMLLTPVFTPPLDTAVGGERLTTQLVGVKVRRGKYHFSYKLLDRFIDMCDRVGVKYLEISHLFTQWGAKHAPKIMAEVDGEYKRIFGWETDAHGEEYATFLRAFLKSFLRHMKQRGDSSRLVFHISDEPSAAHLDDYRRSKAIVADILRGYPIMDALSNIDFYKKGVVDRPIPATSRIEPFIEAGIEGLWTYYCCTQSVGVSNRFIAMPSARNRYIGMQIYKYGIEGFLHWGYNFYNSRYSLKSIDPYLDTCGDKWVPAGDPFSVYPAPDGSCLESLRILVFAEALDDIRAFKLCESLTSRDTVVRELERALGETIVFSHCVSDSTRLLLAREKINALIRKNLSV